MKHFLILQTFVVCFIGELKFNYILKSQKTLYQISLDIKPISDERGTCIWHKKLMNLESCMNQAS